MEIALVKSFHWSLRDIDETDIESLLPFIFRMNAEAGSGEPKEVYCDEVSWL